MGTKAQGARSPGTPRPRGLRPGVLGSRYHTRSPWPRPVPPPTPRAARPMTHGPIRVLWLVKGLGPRRRRAPAHADGAASRPVPLRSAGRLPAPAQGGAGSRPGGRGRPGGVPGAVAAGRSPLAGHAPALAPPGPGGRGPRPLAGGRRGRPAGGPLAPSAAATAGGHHRPQPLGRARPLHPVGRRRHLAPRRRPRRGVPGRARVPSRRVCARVRRSCCTASTSSRSRPTAATRAAVRAELGLDADALVVGTVANLRPVKGYPDLLEAARQVLAKLPDVRFVAVGQGPQEAEIHALHARMGLGQRCSSSGTAETPCGSWGPATCSASPPITRGCPVALMEALALGLPVVATGVGGVTEVVTDGREGLLVDPGRPDDLAAALVDVLTDPRAPAGPGGGGAPPGPVALGRLGRSSQRGDLRRAAGSNSALMASSDRGAGRWKGIPPPTRRGLP